MKLTEQEISFLRESNKIDMESYILRPNGEKVPVYPKNGTDFHWTEIREHLKDEKNADPTFVIVKLTKKRFMLAEDNGFALGLKFNGQATRLYREAGGETPIVGTVLICPKGMVK